MLYPQFTRLSEMSHHFPTVVHKVDLQSSLCGMEPPAGVALQLEEKKWSQQSGLNRRPLVYKTNALPLSYAGLVGSDGLEPSVSEEGRFTVSCNSRYANYPKLPSLSQCRTTSQLWSIRWTLNQA